MIVQMFLQAETPVVWSLYMPDPQIMEAKAAGRPMWSVDLPVPQFLEAETPGRWWCNLYSSR